MNEHIVTDATINGVPCSIDAIEWRDGALKKIEGKATFTTPPDPMFDITVAAILEFGDNRVQIGMEQIELKGDMMVVWFDNYKGGIE